MALVAAGRLFNLLPRAAQVTVPTCSPVESALGPMAAAWDGRSNQLGLFSAAAVKPYVQFDLNCIADGDGENDSVAAWLGSGGTIAIDATTYQSGTKSIKLNHSAAASRYQDKLVRAGEPFALACALCGTGAVTTALKVQNLQTGMWLSSAGAWGATEVAFASRSTASWSTFGPITSAVESASACGTDVATLRITLSISASGAGYLDDLSYVPGYNIGAAAGHSMPSSSSFPLLISADSAVPVGADDTGVAQATATPIRPTCYARFSATRFERWVRFYCGYSTASTPDPVGVGELVLAYATPLSQGHDWNFGWAKQDATRVVAEGADKHRYPQVRGAEQLRELVAKYEPKSQAAYDELAIEVFRRCRAEGYPLLWVADDFDATACILGQIVGDSLATVGAFLSIWQLELRIREMPFPRTFIP